MPVAPQQVIQRRPAGGQGAGGGGLAVLQVKHDQLRGPRTHNHIELTGGAEGQAALGSMHAIGR